MKITFKLFFALLAVTTVIILVNLSLARWSFHQGFLEFISGMERERLTLLSEDLVREYQVAGGSWDWLQEQGFDNFIKEQARAPGRPRNGAPPPLEGRNASDRFPPPFPAGPGRGRPPRDTTGPPTALFDKHRDFVAGDRTPDSATRSINIPLVLNNDVIGELRSWPTAQTSYFLANEFSRQQVWTSFVIALICLTVSGLMSWLLSKKLLRPVRGVLDGVSELTKGNYSVTFAEQRRDELGQLMRDIQTLSQTLDKNRTAKNRWFADISHELRTPLAVLTGEVDVLKAGIRPFDQHQLESFEQEINRLNHLVDDLYQLSLSDLGGLRYAFAPQDVSASIATVVDALQGQAVSQELDLTFNDTTDVHANIDKQRIEQMLLNLGNNSIAYTDAPGKVVFDISQQGDKIFITVNDTYPGVSEEACEHLFDPLFREDASRTRRDSGAGLGLTICKNIVEAHGGNITASPSELGGLQITVELNALTGA